MKTAHALCLVIRAACVAVTGASSSLTGTGSAYDKLYGQFLEFVCLAAGMELALHDEGAKEEVCAQGTFFASQYICTRGPGHGCWLKHRRFSMLLHLHVPVNANGLPLCTTGPGSSG